MKQSLSNRDLTSGVDKDIVSGGLVFAPPAEGNIQEPGALGQAPSLPQWVNPQLPTAPKRKPKVIPSPIRPPIHPSVERHTHTYDGCTFTPFKQIFRVFSRGFSRRKP